MSFKLYDKRDHFNLEIVNFPFLEGDFPRFLYFGASETVFYDLVYRFKGIVGNPNFSGQFKKDNLTLQKVAYNMDTMQRSACLVVNQITVYSCGFLLIARQWVRPQTQ